MSRWEPGATQRIADAAVELFQAHGFERTTAAQIAERAGVTRRTFFRHFADKRDVIFGEHDRLQRSAEEVIALAPPGAGPLEVLSIALHRLADDTFAGAQERVRVLHRIIVADDSLLEREQHKNSVIGAAGERAFVARGMDPTSARLASGLGVLALSTAIERWADAPAGSELGVIIDEVLATISAIAAGQTPE